MEKQKKTEHVEKKEKRRRIIHTQKSYLTAGVIMLVAVIAMAGAYQREKKNAENAQNEAVALAENDWVEPETDTTSTGDETQETMAAQTPESQVSDNLSAQTDTTGISQTDPVQGSTDTTALNSQVQIAGGDTYVIIYVKMMLGAYLIYTAYSMGRDLHQGIQADNPALIIAGAVNDRVTAAADGQVIGVDTTAETGQTVTIGLGDSYQAIYGQLKEVEVSAGDYVKQGDTIGYLAEPTKYYSVEGANLYFSMTKEGKPVNPMDYIR